MDDSRQDQQDLYACDSQICGNYAIDTYIIQYHEISNSIIWIQTTSSIGYWGRQSSGSEDPGRFLTNDMLYSQDHHEPNRKCYFLHRKAFIITARGSWCCEQAGQESLYIGED